MKQELGGGIDWAGTQHVVCILDKDGRMVSSFKIGYELLLASLMESGTRVSIATERDDCP